MKDWREQKIIDDFKKLSDKIKKDLEQFHKKQVYVPVVNKCDFCSVSCGNEWCCVKDKK